MRIKLGILSLALLGACGFLADNKPPNWIYLAEKGANEADCDLTLDLHDDHGIQKFAACVDKKADSVFSQIKGAHSDEFNVAELRLLAERFIFKKGPRVSHEEALALMTLKVLLVGGDPKRVRHDEVTRLTRILREHAKDDSALIKALFAHDYGNAVLTQDTIVGLFRLARRVPELSELASTTRYLDDSTASMAFDLLEGIFGYQHGSALPLHVFALVPTFYDFMLSLEKRTWNYEEVETAHPSRDLFDQLEEALRFKQKAAQVATNELVNKSAYGHGGAFTRRHLEEILTAYNADRTGPSAGQFDPAKLSRQIFAFKHALVGGSLEAVDSTDIARAAEWIVNNSQGNTLSGMSFDYEKDPPKELAKLIPDPAFWDFVSAKKDLLLRRGYVPDRLAGRIGVGNAYQYYEKLRLISAGLSAFDSNHNGVLETQYADPGNEFRSILKGFSVLGRAFSNDMKKESLADRAAATQRRKEGLDLVLDDTMILSSLIFVADNLTNVSNGDGAINGSEMLELLDLVDDIADQAAWAAHMQEPEWRSYVSNSIADELKSCGLTLSPPTLDELTTMRLLEDLRWRYSDYFSKLESEFYIGYGEWLLTLRGIRPDLSTGSGCSLSFLTEEVRDEALTLRDWAQRFGLLNLDTTARNQGLLEVWLKLGANVYDERYPFGTSDYASYRESRDRAHRTSGEYSTEDSRKLRSEQIRFRDIETFLGSRLKRSGFGWLSWKFRLIFLALPDGASQNLLAKLVWNARAISAKLNEQRLTRPDMSVNEALKSMATFATAPGADESIDFEELSNRMSLVAQMLTTLLKN